MAWTLPKFNLVCRIYEIPLPGNFTDKVHRDDCLCQLVPPTRGANSSSTSSVIDVNQRYNWSIRVPKGTDIRDASCNHGMTDFVEVPGGSGRWYFVVCVDDVAKGFTNEYRLAILRKSFLTGSEWPIPIP